MNEHRISLYEDYCTELDRYDPFEREYPSDQVKQVAQSYLLSDVFHWIPIIDGIAEVGFLIVATDLDFFGNGLYICEAYVSPAHRHKGLMANAVAEMLKKFPIVHMEVYMGNPAAEFWQKIMTESGFWESVSEPSPLTLGALHYEYKREGT